MNEPNKKLCDVCQKEIPQDYVNLLCLECYDRQVKDIELRKIQEEEEKRLATTPQDESKIDVATETVSVYNVNGITDPNYIENPEMPDKDQVMTNFAQFQKTGQFLWHTTRGMYEWIKNQAMERARNHPQFPKHIWKPTIVDVGCGCGLGSNILSQEADFVWGIDKNKLSSDFAKECFTRVKNNYYYSSQVSFDNVDIMVDTREFMRFSYIVAVEIIEHISNHKEFLKQLITKFDMRDPRNPSEYFITTPNRNNKHLGKDKPVNRFHCKEFTSGEFFDELSNFFTDVSLHNSLGVPIPKEEYRTTTHTPLLARCSGPKI